MKVSRSAIKGGNSSRGVNPKGVLLAGPLYSQENSNPLSSTKILITNLDNKVTDSDICELFSELGTIREVAVHYNCWGYSLGSAHVVYLNSDHATDAARRYNGVPFDGRPMTITLEGAPSGNARKAPLPVKMRLSFGPNHPSQKAGKTPKRLGAGPKTFKLDENGAAGRGVARGLGKPRGRLAVLASRQPTAAELDLELEEYVNQGKTSTNETASNDSEMSEDFGHVKNVNALMNGGKTPAKTPRRPLIKQRKTPGKTPSRTPGKTPSRTPGKTPSRTPKSVKAATKTPGKTPSRIPGKSARKLDKTPKTPGVASKTPGKTPSKSPGKIVKTPNKTPLKTPTKTPAKTPKITPAKTPKITPAKTPKKTPAKTPKKTPAKTPKKTPAKSPKTIPTATLTPAKTPVKTAPEIEDKPLKEVPVNSEENVADIPVVTKESPMEKSVQTPAKSKTGTPAKRRGRPSTTRTPAKIEPTDEAMDSIEDLENIEPLHDLSKSVQKITSRRTSGRFSRLRD